MIGAKAVDVATVPNQNDLLTWQPLFVCQIPFICLAIGEVVVYQAADEAIYCKPRLPSSPPVLPQVGRLDNERHTAHPTDGRCKEAGIELMRVEDVNAAFP